MPLEKTHAGHWYALRRALEFTLHHLNWLVENEGSADAVQLQKDVSEMLNSVLPGNDPSGWKESPL